MTYFKESPVAVTIHLLSKKWTTEIILELMNGRKRFSDLLEIDDSLTSKVLSDRLKVLLDYGIIEKIVINMMPLKMKYQLSDKGRLLNRIFFECALYGCFLFPDKIFTGQQELNDNLIDELQKNFQIENVNIEELKKNYFTKN